MARFEARVRSCKLGNPRHDADNPECVGALGNTGSLEIECDERADHRTGLFGGRKKH